MTVFSPHMAAKGTKPGENTKQLRLASLHPQTKDKALHRSEVPLNS